MRRLTTSLTALLLTISAGQVTAAGIPLSALFGGASVLVGDTLYEDFTLINNEVCAATNCLSGAIDSGNIMVEGVGDGTAGNEFGMRFSGANGVLTQIGDSFLNFWFGFSVTAIGTDQEIFGTSMVASTSIQGNEAIIVAQKDIFENDGIDKQGSIEVFDDPGFTGTDLNASLSLNGFNKIWVQDNILIDGFGGSAQLDSLTQRFMVRTAVQGPDPLPVSAPTTLALIGLGLISLGWARRKKLS